MYEEIHSRVKDFVRQLELVQELQNYPSTLRFYLYNEWSPLLYRIAECQIFCEMLGSNNVICYSRSHPILEWLTLGKVPLIYDMKFSKYLRFIEREKFDGDKINLKNSVNYRINRIKEKIKSNRILVQKKPVTIRSVVVDILHPRFNFSKMNELFWLYSKPDLAKQTVCIIPKGFDFENSGDLIELGVNLAFLRYPFDWITLFKEKDHFSWHIGMFRLQKKTVSSQQLISSCKWLRAPVLEFYLKVSEWENIYSRLNAKVVWSMADGDKKQYYKKQAINNLGGFYVGSHWSNYPMSKLENMKCYDYFYVWSKHFAKLWNFYPYRKYIPVGYPSRYSFKQYEKPAKLIRDKYPGKFILSYHDNNVSKDSPYSEELQINLHQMLCGLLERYENLIVFLKPKKKSQFKDVENLVPRIKYYNKKGRIIVFLGELPRSKAVPILIGLASDLSVGLGISTSVIESAFAGGVSLHLDQMKLENPFSKNYPNIVLHSVDDLEKKIEVCLRDGVEWLRDDCRRAHLLLDPFNDNNAHKRVSYEIDKILFKNESLITQK
jgi:hypothetical protein